MNLGTFRPAYFARRLRQLAFERAQPDAPWLTESAVLLLNGWLRASDVGLEWGSGRSTVWFARRVTKLISIEDDREWHAQVAAKLDAAGLAAKVDYRFIPCELCEQDEPSAHPYAEVARTLSDGALDFALVDGNIRARCMAEVIPKIRSGGMLILDNANRYVPNVYSNGHSTVHEPRDEPRTPAWRDIIEELSSWRSMHTSDGIWDTRFWISP